MSLRIDDGDVRLHVGDCIEVMRALPAASIDCCVTSPPYWRLRDYGVDGQIGLEPTPDEFVDRLVAVFDEVHRLMTPHGTLWVNLGDSYAASPGSAGRQGANGQMAGRTVTSARRVHSAAASVKPKDLVGVPWLVAFALRAAGWWLRADVIWAKPNPMPESVRDRPTKAHEYLFLLTKADRYYYDAEAVKEPVSGTANPRGNGVNPKAATSPGSKGRVKQNASFSAAVAGLVDRRNARSVWTIPSQPYPEAHFATFPEELPRRAILAGCPERVCTECGAPSERIVERTPVGDWNPRGTEDRAVGRTTNVLNNSDFYDGYQPPRTVGWTDCGHDAWRPGVVLDPFSGSGTTLLAARQLSRHAVGVELNIDYADLAGARLRQLSLLGGVA